LRGICAHLCSTCAAFAQHLRSCCCCHMQPSYGTTAPDA
jgi:hypothetical protein